MTDTLKYIDVNPDDAKRMAQRMHVKKDDIQLVRKGYEIKIEDQNDDDRTITARVSTADRDRDGEIVEPKGIDLKDYRGNPVLGWAHKYDHPAVGKALWSRTDADGLICKFQFAETQFADELYQLYKGGFMKAFSIGFIPMEYDQKTKTHEKISLLEVSCVLVPANQSALVMEAYAKGLIKSDALKKDLGLESDPVAEPAPITDGAIQPKIDFCNACGTPKGIVESEPAPVAKMLDLDKNPAVADIWGALNSALNPPMMMEKPGSVNSYKCIWDVYPVDYPSGHCVYGEHQEDGTNLGYMVDYTYDKGVVTLGENPIPVASGYVRRGRKDIGNLSVKIDVDTSEAEAKVNALKAKVDAMAETYKAIEAKATPAPLAEVPASPPPPADDIDIEPDEDVLTIEPSESILTLEPSAPKPAPAPKTLTEADVKDAIGAAVDRLDLRAVIDKSIKDNLDRLRGRVR